jgi:CheY-like chemotaxis protein
MAAEMSSMLAVSISKKAVVSCRLYENLPMILADAVQMRQVLMNLIMNASEAVGETGGSISISTGIRECSREYLSRIRPATPLKEGVYVFLEVADTGCGMARETVERMFDPFYSTKSPGRGLGLSAVMGIIRAQAGGLCVETAPGKGTTFTLLFPPAQATEMSESVQPEVSAGWRGSGTVLLVDDEEMIRLVCGRMLQYLGFDVLTAKDGREAIALFAEHHDKIRCVLLDFAMPHLNGEETFYELRKIDPGARVILSSGYLVEDVMARFTGQGLAGFIHKPYQLDQFVEVMKKVFAE